MPRLSIFALTRALKDPSPKLGTKKCTKCRLESYWYLRSIMTNRLKFNLNVETMREKGLQRLHRLRKLSHFHVEKILRAPPIFNKSRTE